MQGFGPHLMVDLEGCPKHVLQDLNLHFEFLNKTPDTIGMTKITQPHVFPYEGLVPGDRGITGTVIIAESHLSVHSFEEKGYVFIDVFSCKPFNIELALSEIQRLFQPTKMVYHLVNRGVNFPRG